MDGPDPTDVGLLLAFIGLHASLVPIGILFISTGKLLLISKPWPTPGTRNMILSGSVSDLVPKLQFWAPNQIDPPPTQEVLYFSLSLSGFVAPLPSAGTNGSKLNRTGHAGVGPCVRFPEQAILELRFLEPQPNILG